MTKISPKNKYKYRIHELLQNLPLKQNRSAMNYLPVRLGVGESTFKSWIYIKSNESREIPSKALLMLSEFFGIAPKQLYTEEIPSCNIDEIKQMNKKANLNQVG